MDKKVVYFIYEKNKGIKSIIIPFLDIRFSSTQGLLKPSNLAIKLHRAKCHIDFEENLKHLINCIQYIPYYGGDKEDPNFILVFEILKTKIMTNKDMINRYLIKGKYK